MPVKINIDPYFSKSGYNQDADTKIVLDKVIASLNNNFSSILSSLNTTINYNYTKKESQAAGEYTQEDNLINITPNRYDSGSTESELLLTTLHELYHAESVRKRDPSRQVDLADSTNTKQVAMLNKISKIRKEYVDDYHATSSEETLAQLTAIKQMKDRKLPIPADELALYDKIMKEVPDANQWVTNNIRPSVPVLKTFDKPLVDQVKDFITDLFN